MKIKVGPPVCGDDFFNREKLIEKTWEKIEAGSNILIAAPRRVGKTSIMHQLKDDPIEGFAMLYLNTESINNGNEFFRRLLNVVLKTDLVKNSQKILVFLKKHKPTITKVAVDGIEFGVGEEHDYFEMLNSVLKTLEDNRERLIIMIDEFSETLANIIKDESEKAGRLFLHGNRELRLDEDIQKKVQFIYTGSIGLEQIVSKLNAVQVINDLYRLKIPPLNKKESNAMIALLLGNVSFTLSEQATDYLLEKIHWLVPFYIQLMIDELRNLNRDEDLKVVDNQAVDRAIDNMLEQRQHFEHWHTRLRGSLRSSEYNFAKELLSLASENESITINEITDLSVKYELEGSFRDLLSSLVYDGYINNADDDKLYRFNSPLVKIWWRKNVAR
jgi:hypothetical protein